MAQSAALIFVFLGAPVLFLVSLAALAFGIGTLRRCRSLRSAAFVALSLVVGVSTGLITYGAYSAEVVAPDGGWH
jgi:hypothetical protein